MDPSRTDEAGNEWTAGSGTGTVVAVEVGDERALLVIRTTEGFRHLRTTRIDPAAREIVEMTTRALIGRHVQFETVQRHGVGYTPPEIRALDDQGTDYDFDAADPEYQAPAIAEPESDAPAEVVGELLSVVHDEPSSRFLIHIATDTGVQQLWTGATTAPGDSSARIRGLAMALNMVVGKRVRAATAGQPPVIASFRLDR
jgi:hypothetical protein